MELCKDRESLERAISGWLRGDCCCLCSIQSQCCVFWLSLAAVFIVLLVLETVADQQQWEFQSFKHSLTPEERSKHPSKV
jgi:hypothetical protein